MLLKLQNKVWLRWLFFFAGLEIVAMSINLFYAPAEVAAGGSTGIAIIFDTIWGINRSLSVFIINFLMIIIAIFFLEKETMRKITMGSLLLPLLMGITPSFKVTNNAIIAVLFGGILMGLGVSLLYLINSSSGGTTIPPMILKKHFALNSGISLLIIDMLIIFLNIFSSGWQSFFLAAFSQIITCVTMNSVETIVKRVDP